MLYIKAFHIIAVIAWFAGLFYLPRLYVYHAETVDKISIDRFKTMERRLYYFIMWPSFIATVVFGVGVMLFNPMYYLKQPWFHAKLTLVLILATYHLACGHYLRLFLRDLNVKPPRFFRFFNEIPTLLLVFIVILVVVKPHF